MSQISARIVGCLARQVGKSTTQVTIIDILTKCRYLDWFELSKSSALQSMSAMLNSNHSFPPICDNSNVSTILGWIDTVSFAHKSLSSLPWLWTVRQIVIFHICLHFQLQICAWFVLHKVHIKSWWLYLESLNWLTCHSLWNSFFVHKLFNYL